MQQLMHLLSSVKGISLVSGGEVFSSRIQGSQVLVSKPLKGLVYHEVNIC